MRFNHPTFEEHEFMAGVWNEITDPNKKHDGNNRKHPTKDKRKKSRKSQRQARRAGR